MAFMQLEELFLLVVGPWLFVDCWVEVVVPTFPALLARPLGNVIRLLQFMGNLGPVVEAVLRHQFRDSLVLLNNHTST